MCSELECYDGRLDRSECNVFYVRGSGITSAEHPTFEDALAYADRLHCRGLEWVGVYAGNSRRSSLVVSLLSPE